LQEGGPIPGGPGELRIRNDRRRILLYLIDEIISYLRAFFNDPVEAIE